MFIFDFIQENDIPSTNSRRHRSRTSSVLEFPQKIPCFCCLRVLSIHQATLYRYLPSLLLSFVFLILAGGCKFADIVKGTDDDAETQLATRIVDLLFQLPAVWAIISEMARRRQTKIDRFINVRCQIQMN